MNFINLSYFAFLVIMVTFGDEILIKNTRRNRYKSVGPLSSTSATMTSTTTTPVAATSTEIKKVEDDENNAEHSNDDKSLINDEKHVDVVISSTPETLKRMTRPTRDNQALFSALKKRRKDAYQNKASKKLGQQFEDDTKHEQSDHEAEKKFTKKSSTYRNKSKHAQKKDSIAEDNDAAPAVITDKKTRRFSVRV